jgi:ferredoxin-NADP reductase/ferredoxin
MFSLFKKKKPFQAIVDGSVCELQRKRTLLDSILEQGLKVPYSCQVGACQRCLAKVQKGAVKSLINLDFCLTKQQIAEGMILACQAVPESDVELKFQERAETVQAIHSATITDIQHLSHDVSRVAIECQLMPVVGQSCLIYMPELKLGRYYSVVTSTGYGQFKIDVALKANGVCSPWLSDRENIGKSIKLSNPEGGFGQIRGNADNYLAVAGGSALGVILGILENWLNSHPEMKITLVHAVRKRQDAYDLDRMRSLRRNFSGFDYLIALSRESVQEEDFLSQPAPELLNSMFSGTTKFKLSRTTHFLMCGSDSLINSCQKVIFSHSVSLNQCQIESFG